MDGFRLTLTLALVSGTAACSLEAERDEPATPEGPGITTTGSLDPTDAGDGDGDGEVLDVGGGATGGGPGDEQSGCEKIDFLFVVDNSGSMEDEQTNLVGSFPKFIDTIRSETTATDYHLMVVDTDECDPGLGAGNDLQCDADLDPSCCENTCTTLPGATCNGAACACPPAPDACHARLGGGRIHDANGSTCGVQGDRRYMGAGQADLEDVFSCAATVGIDGSGNEQTVDALLAALEPDMNGPGGCNDGFLRDDALLVVTIISDEEDDPEIPLPGVTFGSEGDPSQWHDAVIDHKGGNPKHAVVLSLVGPPPPDDCPPLNKATNAIHGAELASRLVEFTQLFEFGFVGPVCAPDYDPFFQQAVQVIDQACNEFVPPG